MMKTAAHDFGCAPPLQPLVSTMDQPNYLLRDSVYLCRSGGYWFFLDLERNRYSCHTEAHLQSLLPLPSDPGPRHQSGDTGRSPAAADAAEIIAELMDQGILTLNPAEGKPVRPTDRPLPTLDLAACKVRISKLRCAYRLPGFLASSRYADRHLETAPLQGIIQRFQRRKQMQRRSGAGASCEAARLAAAFEALRPIYPRPYVCLFDSFALAEFLSRCGVFPDWIFGIRAEPFEAHCWVQVGNIVLNDTVEQVQRFTPIMAV
jgi:hypothetical protein